MTEELCPVCGCEKTNCICDDECESCGAQPMVEARQTPKPLAGTIRTNDTSMVSKGRVTRQQLLNRGMKKTKNKMMKRMKPLRGGM
mgnify:CR=1 FL=1